MSIKTIIKNDSSLKANEFIYFDIAPHDVDYNSNVRFQAKYKFIEEIPMLLNSFYDVTKFTTAEKKIRNHKKEMIMRIKIAIVGSRVYTNNIKVKNFIYELKVKYKR